MDFSKMVNMYRDGIGATPTKTASTVEYTHDITYHPPMVGKFEKVSYDRFAKDVSGSETILQDLKLMYDSIVLPTRATVGSNGYDIRSPFDFSLNPGDTIKIPTGIRAIISSGWWLAVIPKSGLGFKYRLQLDNTVGDIDSDYSGSSNEGHIFVKLTNDSKNGKRVNIKAGDGIAQGIFLPFGITYDDDATGVRDGGFGSTGR